MYCIFSANTSIGIGSLSADLKKMYIGNLSDWPISKKGFISVYRYRPIWKKPYRSYTGKLYLIKHPYFLCKSTSGCCYKCVRGRLSCQSHLEKKCNRKCQIYFPSWLERFSARALLWEQQWFGSICFVFFVIFKVLGINLVVA